MTPPKLLTLPPELLSNMFHNTLDVSGSAWQLTSQPICRALLPFQQEVLYRDPQSKSLPSLIKTLESDPSLASMVKGLTRWSVYGFHFQEEQIVRLLSLVGNIRELFLYRTEVTSRALALYNKARGGLDHLQYLTIESFEESNDVPFLEFITNCPSLTSLKLHLYDDTEFFTSEIPLPGIKILELDVWDCSSEDSFTSFPCKCFPSLHTLKLNGDDTFPCLHSLLPLLYPFRSSLRSLTLRFDSESDNLVDNPSLPSRCDTQLVAFSSLSYLYLEGCMLTHDVDIALLNLPQLETLGFGEGIPLSEDRLEQLVIGPARLPRLKRLILDLLPLPYGEEKFDPFDRSDFTFEALDVTVKKIRESGVRVDGTDLNVLERTRKRIEDEENGYELYRTLQGLTTAEEDSEEDVSEEGGSEMEGEGSNRG